MKKIFKFALFLFLAHTTPMIASTDFDPDEDETNCSDCGPELISSKSFKLSTPPLLVELFYIGSPVDQRRLLVVKADCDGKGKYKVIFEKKECDFSTFESKGSEFNYTNYFYNPLNGECDRKATVEQIDVLKYCKKPKFVR